VPSIVADDVRQPLCQLLVGTFKVIWAQTDNLRTQTLWVDFDTSCRPITALWHLNCDRLVVYFVSSPLAPLPPACGASRTSLPLPLPGAYSEAQLSRSSFCALF
jgi:hypothetical protein